MLINKCFHVFEDNTTLFQFQNNHLTITACNTHTCGFTLSGMNFTLGACTTTTSNSCSTDVAEKYIPYFQNTTHIKLQSNIMGFMQGEGNGEKMNIQLRNVGT